jgi:hypothetical protein
MKPPGIEIRKEQRMKIRDVKAYRLAAALARLALFNLAAAEIHDRDRR